MSASDAVTGKTSRLPGPIVTLPGGVITGAWLTSNTSIRICSDALRLGYPLSVTRMVTALVAGPSSSPGIHAKAPVCAWMLAPVGAPGSRLKVSVCGGVSVSVATTMKLNKACSFTCLFPMGVNTGTALFVLTMFDASGVGIAIV
ncbi:MAG: hypothetical protein BWY59_00148 [Verrucomicrobia bacterium ADurb.Bin345]|nr:MAG: hypothetical protein BWY59_00148 [Verrucomicrobia bacterium ADurb.Bin345]